MKKGKPNVPANMRSQYNKRKEMSQAGQDMIASQSPGSDGFPIFNLFVRTKTASIWYPCGSFKGDERSMALATTWRDGGLLAGVSKNQLDGGIAGSLHQEMKKLTESAVRTYPQLRKSREDLEFGYKLAFEGLSVEQQQTCVVEPKENKGLADSVKYSFKGMNKGLWDTAKNVAGVFGLNDEGKKTD